MIVPLFLAEGGVVPCFRRAPPALLHCPSLQGLGVVSAPWLCWILLPPPTSGSAEVWLPFVRVMLWPSRVCRVSRGRCICLVSCFNSPIRRWLVRRSASTSSVLACIVSNAPRGQLSTSPSWSCILGGLALLLLMFQVDTISY